MRYSVAITSLLAVSLVAVQWRPHVLNGDSGAIGDEGTRYESELNIFIAGNSLENFEVKSLVASLGVRGIAFSQSTTDDCTDSSTVHSTTLTSQGIATLPSSTEDCTETTILPSVASTAQGTATLPSSTEDCTNSTTLPSITSTVQGLATTPSSSEDCTETSTLSSITSITQGTVTLSSSGEGYTGSSTIPSTTSTAQGIATLPSSTDCTETSNAPLYTSVAQTSQEFEVTSTAQGESTVLSSKSSTISLVPAGVSTSTILSSSTVLIITTVTAAPSGSSLFTTSTFTSELVSALLPRDHFADSAEGLLALPLHNLRYREVQPGSAQHCLQFPRRRLSLQPFNSPPLL
jgi:hypothetical protein